MAKKVLIATNESFALDSRTEAVSLLRGNGFDVEVLEDYVDQNLVNERIAYLESQQKFDSLSAEEADKLKKDIRKEAQERVQQEILAERMAGVNYLVVRSDIVGKIVIDSSPNLELIVRAGAGFDNVKDPDSLRENRNIDVMNTPDMNSRSVAEYVFALALSNLRNILPAHNALAFNGKSIKKTAIGQELWDKKIAIYGLGYIGTIVSQIANGYGMKVCTFDPGISAEWAKKFGAEKVDTIEKLCEGAFMLTLHASLNPSTKKSITYERLSLMDKNGVLVNAARDNILDAEGIARMLAEFKDFRYCSDFGMNNLELEKQFPGRLVLTPHLGASTFEANRRTILAATNQIISYMHGEDSAVVNRHVVPFKFKDYGALASKIGVLARELVGGPARELRVICYGDLEKNSEAFAQRAFRGFLTRDNGPEMRREDFNAAYRSITRDIREPNKTKDYGNSITLDILTQNGESSSVSIRGTMSENNPVIARVEDFHHLYFAPEGMVAFFMYQDKPGKMDRIGKYFTECGYNKSNIRAAQSRDKKRALAIIQIEKNDDPEKMCAELSSIVSKILASDHDVYRAAFVNFGLLEKA